MLGRSNTVYYLKIDSQSFLIGDKNISSRKRENLVLSPTVECVFGSSSSQTNGMRRVCPSFARRLVLKEFSLSKFLCESKGKTTENKSSSNSRPFEPFFISKWPPRFAWDQIDICASQIQVLQGNLPLDIERSSGQQDEPRPKPKPAGEIYETN